MNETKRCPMCTQTKPVAEYQKNRASWDGMQSRCRDCTNAVTRKSRAANRASVSEVQHFRGKYAGACRWGTEADQIEARRNLAVAKIVQYVEEVLADAPPLTDDDRQRLAALLEDAE